MPAPADPPLDENRAYMDEAARRALGEPARTVRVAEARPAQRRIRDLRATAAAATDDRPGPAGAATRLARRTAWLARDAHGRAHLETAAVLEGVEERLAAVEDALVELADLRAELRAELEALRALVRGDVRP
jgi:hypothetical protein